MYTKNLTVRELYASIGPTRFIVELFQKGLEMNNDRLAISAMEELIRRGDTDSIAKSLNQAFERDQIAPESTMSALIGSSLADGAREIDPLLHKYGKGLLSGEFTGPSQWVRDRANQFRKVYRSGTVRNAHPWASTQIWAESDDNG